MPEVMTEPRWLTEQIVLACQREMLLLDGGLPGVRDKNLLTSTLSKPKNAWAYGTPKPDLFDLAALYILGVARNHPFNDGNKRTALLCGLTFLELNQHQLMLNNVNTVDWMIDIATGDITLSACARHLRAAAAAAAAKKRPKRGPAPLKRPV